MPTSTSARSSNFPAGATNRRPARSSASPGGSRVLPKRERYQDAGAFKPRGDLGAVWELAPGAGRRGGTAGGGGTHGVAVGDGRRARGPAARVVMPRTASPARVQGCREYG